MATKKGTASKKTAARKTAAKKRAAPARASSAAIFTGFAAQTDRIQAAKESAARQLLRPPQVLPLSAFSALAATTSPAPDTNLVGVGIGEKLSGGKHTGVLGVKFLVRIKYPDNQIPDSERLPTDVNGVPVDVEQCGTLRRLQQQMPNPRARITPARPGCSIGFRHPAFNMAGTFGALVRRGTSRFILSNNHVIADENNLPLDSNIFQPGFLDAGSPPNNRAIARLTEFVPLAPGVLNKVDAAIARLNSPSAATNSILFLGPPRGKTRARIDMVVHKFGRTTGFTVGRVTSVMTDVNVQYEAGVFTFEDQIIIRGLDAQPFSASGDSGSLILERSTQRAVGLLFAGSSTHTIANHIDDVLNSMGVSLVL